MQLLKKMPHMETSISEENVGASSDSFWEIGQYKRAVKRVEDGVKLCSDLTLMMRERGEIEASYAKALHHWSKKWSDHIEKGAEYGSSQVAWQSLTEEARCRGDLHSHVRDRLIDEVCNVIKLWSKDTFHKSTFGVVKEGKEVEDAFKKAQKTWVKLYTKVMRTRRDYFNASRLERSAINQEKNAKNNSDISIEQAKKLSEKALKCRDDRDKAERAYKKALDDLSEHKPRYQEDMIQVFKRCQEKEVKRLRFFKEMLQGVHVCLDLSAETKLKTIYSTMRAVIDRADAEKDVDWWEKQQGPGMSMNWPVFEPYTPEIRDITKKRQTSKEVEPVTLISQRLSISEPNGTTAEKENSLNQSTDQKASSPCDKMDGAVDGSPDSPFDDEWDDGEQTCDGSVAESSAKKGILVKALYDYDKQEDDELSFKKGDIFEKLEEEDEQGWCKGRKDGVTGLYPANYAVVHAN
uniref:SH3 domain-containing protein n=1 Tax=Trichuris muris TaxID=70415 RepID=A0A5S6QSH0_TRIMR